MKKNILQLWHRILSRLRWNHIWVRDAFSLNPKDFSWKVRWRMKNDRNPLFIALQDKYMVKRYACERGVQTPETYYITDNAGTIPFDSLPDNCFIKANHGCGWNILRREHEYFLYENGADLIGQNTFSKRKLTQQECVDYCNSWLKCVYSRSQWAYHQIVPMVFAEEILKPLQGEVLVDYRCFTFQGIVKAIQISSPLYHQKNENMFVDSCWQEHKLKVYREKVPCPSPTRPDNFQEIVVAAEKLGKDLDFARIDLYNTTRGVVLGEMTIYPEGGDMEVPTGDPEFNKWLGDQWILPFSKKLTLFNFVAGFFEYE